MGWGGVGWRRRRWRVCRELAGEGRGKGMIRMIHEWFGI